MTATWTAGQCRSCKAQVIWCFTVNDRKMPVDATPNQEKGNIVILQRPGRDPLAVLLSNLNEEARAAAKRHDVPLYTSHFFTCPHAKRHRTKPRAVA